MSSTFWPDIQPLLPDEKIKSDNPGYERAKHHLQALQRLLGDSDDTCPLVTPMCMHSLVAGIDFSRYQREKSNIGELKQEVSGSFNSEKSTVLELINSMLAVTDALDRLDQTLKVSFSDTGLQTPGSQFLRKQIDANLAAIKVLTDGLISPWPPDVHAQSIANDTVPSPEPPEDVSDSNEKNEEHTQSTQTPRLTGDINFTRDQAFHQIRLLADFFQRTEPQSPVPYIWKKPFVGAIPHYQS